MHEVSVFKLNYSLYQIIQIVLFYKNISSEDIKLLADVAWEKENSRVPQVENKWTKIYMRSQNVKPIYSLDWKSVFKKNIQVHICQVQSECNLNLIHIRVPQEYSKGKLLNKQLYNWYQFTLG